VAAEFATVGSRRSRVQEAAEGGSGPAARLLAILQDPKLLDNYVAACQIGITLSSLVAGAYGQAQLTPLLEPVFGAAGRVVAVLVVLVAITSLQVVLGELLPKTAALRYPETLAMATLRPMQVSQWLFRPLVAAFNGSAFSLMRWWGLEVDHSHAHVHSPEELAGAVPRQRRRWADRCRRAGHARRRAERGGPGGPRDHDAPPPAGHGGCRRDRR
jgi:putative hemolysin